ncbi:Uncharacterized protein APZ42_002846 [Daphnia magna]|uniref:Transmembrane protein n=1 Tax=Daphnia magna TaxID=35525 RepID=A0A164HZZ5_9CRUS|nr:Uncharacterized protein APZ42_002846 [Daphnia magna]
MHPKELFIIARQRVMQALHTPKKHLHVANPFTHHHMFFVFLFFSFLFFFFKRKMFCVSLLFCFSSSFEWNLCNTPLSFLSSHQKLKEKSKGKKVNTFVYYSPSKGKKGLSVVPAGLV